MFWKKYILVVLFSCITLAMQSQVLKLEDGPSPWEGGVNFGLNNDGYEWEIRMTYFKNQYLGLKLGAGFAGEIKEIEDWDYDDPLADRDYTLRFVFNPAIVIRSPRIIHWKNQDAGFYLYTEPGLIMSPGAAGSRNAKWLRWDVKSGINLQIDRYIITVGYGISNFSLYSGSPENHWGYPEKTEYITHTVFVGGGIKF